MNYHVLGNSIVLNYDGNTEVIAKDDKRFDKIIECIKEHRLDDIQDIVESNVKYFTEQGLTLIDGIVHVNDVPLPHELSGRIMAYKEVDLPFDSLLKFWDNLKQNSSFNSRQMLFKFLEHNGHPITEDGCFIAYKGVTNDFKDRHTKTFDNSVGNVCEISRSQVDDNPNNTCSSGLHVACYDYAYNWAGNDGHTVEVKVNPKDVVCVPTDYNGTKMRVSKYEVVGIAEGERHEVLYNQDDEYKEEECCDECGELEEDCVCDLEDLDDEGCYCPHCSEELEDYFTYCPNCGYSL